MEDRISLVRFLLITFLKERDFLREVSTDSSGVNGIMAERSVSSSVTALRSYFSVDQ